MNITKKISILLTVLGASALVNAAVLINADGGFLYESDGSTPLKDGSLVYFVSSATTDFTQSLDSAYVIGDQQVLFSTTTNSVDVGSPGYFQTQAQVDLGSGVSAGDQIYMVWFSNLSSLQDNVIGGLEYGVYTADDWKIPQDGNILTIGAYNTSLGGTLDDSLLVANKTTVGSNVPEPSSYAAIFGALALGFVGYKRRRS